MQKINKIIKLLSKEYPGKKPALSKSNLLDVLIATMLSQNTTDKASYAAFRNLKELGNWEKILKTPVSRIQKAIRICGLAKQKAVNIKAVLSEIKKTYGKISLNFIRTLDNQKIREQLLKYKGVGLKTVSCVIAFGLGRDEFPVDTHVHRLSNRLGLVDTKSPDKTYELMNKIIPDGEKFSLHTFLIRYGRNVCRAKNPVCGECVLYDLCVFPQKKNLSPLPRRGAQGRGFAKNDFLILEHV